MSENNSKIPTVIALILLALILISVLFLASQPKVAAPSVATSSQSVIKPSQSVTNQKDKCIMQNPKSTKIGTIDQEKLKRIKIEDIAMGAGEQVQSGDVICIDYKGTLENGTEFDQSYKRGQPFVTQIGIGQVIQGWDLGIVGLKEGGKRKLTIPADLAYGSRATSSIPADSTLIFEVELVKIIK